MTRRCTLSARLHGKWRRVGVGALLAALAVATAAQAQAPAPAEQYGKPLGSAGAPPPGASSCSGCHPVSPAVDTPAARLIGRPPADIVTAVQAFRSGQRPATVMERIAKGFTDDEIKAIADWYGAQK
jgi:sulfide dehydrogenase cytochrome subunit